MDKALLTKQLEIVKSLPPGQTCAFTLEVAGVLEAFVQSRANVSDLSPGERALHAKIQTLLQAWEESGSTSPDASSNREKRTQLALRNAIDKATAGSFESITPEEIKLLHATYEIFSRKSQADPQANHRLLDLLSKTLATLEANQDKLVNVPDACFFETTAGAGGIFAKRSFDNNIMADSDFNDIQKTSMNRVEQIDLEINVRVFEFKGDTSVSGDIPSDVLVTVEEGDLVVDGFVAGYVVADQDIEIAGNIQGGGAISNFGNITLERSLMGAVLVSKRGNITCDHPESPRCAFAWDTLTVNGPCLAGEATAGAMVINGKVTAATLHSCGHIVAEEFTTSSRDETVVYLSSEITCDEYKRPMLDAHEERHRQVAQLYRKIAGAKENDAVMLRFIHNLYRTGLFFLLGGVESANTATDLQGKQVRALYLGQIISFATGVSKFYHEALASPEEYPEDVIIDFDSDGRDTLSTIQKDVEMLPDEFGETHKRYLLERLGELKGVAKMVSRECLEERSSITLDSKFASRLSEWRADYRELEESVQEMIANFGLEREVLERIEHEPEGLEDMLQDALNEKAASSDLDEVQRAKSPLITLLRRAADRSKRYIEKSLDVVEESRKQLKRIITDLEEEGVVKFAPNIPSATLVKGKAFAPEVVITASPISRSGRDTNLARVIVLRDSITQETVFVLKDKMIQRVISN